MGGVLRSTGSKIEDRRWGVLRSSGSEDRRWRVLRSSRSINRRTPPFTIFEAEDRRTPPSSIFDLRPRISKNPPSSIFGPEEWVEDRTEDGGGGNSSKIGEGFFEYGRGSSVFRVRRTKNPLPSSIFGAGRMKNPPNLPPSRSEDRRTPPPSSSSDPPSLDQWPPAPRSYPGIWSSARSSTLKIGPKIEISLLLDGSDRVSTAPICAAGFACALKVCSGREIVKFSVHRIGNVNIFEEIHTG